MEEKGEHLSHGELTLPYSAWEAMIKERLPRLAPSEREWLFAWNAHDLAMNVRDDNERRFERRGHYLGWLDAKVPTHAPVGEPTWVGLDLAKEVD